GPDARGLVGVLTRSVRSTLANGAGHYARENDARGCNGGNEDSDVPLDDRAENVWSDERHGNAAERAAGRHHQVVRSEISGMWFEAGELAMAEQADEEHRGEVYE